ncbi:hypothetical protein [Ponticoccus litoralis]|uniref:P22 coat-protein 5 family protein n=1 Tax=Ponticoccus litoralis TaxID=422297 RepID=A0AAW9S579_9RHOB
MATSMTLTGIIPTLYEAMNTVSREMVGMVPAVRRDSNVERAAVGQTVRSPIGVAGDLEDITPGQDPANSGGSTLGYTDVTISKSKAAPILWSGEEQRAVGTSGTYNAILADQFADGMRKLVNAMEVDLWAAAYQAASRGYGTAGTAPFGTAGDLSDFAGVAKILDDNGAPVTDRQMVLGSAAMANLRGKQSVLFKVNEAGSQDMLRNGMTDRVQNFAMRYSGGISTHTKGTGTGYQLSAAGAVGDTTISVDTGLGTLLAGDVVTFAGTSDKYIANSEISGGSFTIGKPGLLAVEDGSDAITIGSDYVPNLAFARSAIVLAARAPALPDGGDSADDRTTITDPFSGLSFEVSVYRQYRRVKYEIAMAWGVGVPNSAHIATLIG